jgi:hypothetical protein
MTFNQNNGFGRKMRYGSAWLGITAAVLVGVLLLNVLVSFIFRSSHTYIDMTSEPLYTLSADCEKMLADTFASANANRTEEEGDVVVDIIFCADPDRLFGNFYLRNIYYTALSMQKLHPDSIRVSTTDVWKNPSSVDAYRSNSYSTIHQTDVIVASGSEFRVYSYNNFYIYDTNTGDSEPWGYSGEKNFLRGIIAVTRAETPICALTVNHGEPFATEEGRAEYSEFLKVIESAGYDVVFLDLEKEEIPDKCRLVITFDPQNDFASISTGAEVSETYKLDDYLDEVRSYLVFVDADTPRLPIWEEYLDVWGISINRYDGKDSNGDALKGTLEILDPINSLDAAGETVVGQYATTALGGSLTKDMREKGASPKVVFRNAASISYSPTYQTTYVIPDDENQLTEGFTHGTYFKNEDSRKIFDVFTAGADSFAYARAEGDRITDAAGADLVVDTFNPGNPYRLMTITRQSRIVGEGQGYTTVDDSSYVCAIASTDFACNDVLESSAYGNTDALRHTLRLIGCEVEPVGLKWVTIYEDEINEKYNPSTTSTAWTVVLALVPAFAMLLSGVVVLVKRRVRT